MQREFLPHPIDCEAHLAVCPGRKKGTQQKARAPDYLTTSCINPILFILVTEIPLTAKLVRCLKLRNKVEFLSNCHMLSLSVGYYTSKNIHDFILIIMCYNRTKTFYGRFSKGSWNIFTLQSEKTYETHLNRQLRLGIEFAVSRPILWIVSVYNGPDRNELVISITDNKYEVSILRSLGFHVCQWINWPCDALTNYK